MNNITYEDVQIFLSETALNFLPSQNKICFPIIARIHRRLQQGSRFDHIKVTQAGIISDGHHRYVCLCILGIDVNTTPAGENHNSVLKLQWGNVSLDTADWDSSDKIIEYEIKYD